LELDCEAVERRVAEALAMIAGGVSELDDCIRAAAGHVSCDAVLHPELDPLRAWLHLRATCPELGHVFALAAALARIQRGVRPGR
jgi:hypothetical protein